MFGLRADPVGWSLLEGLQMFGVWPDTRQRPRLAWGMRPPEVFKLRAYPIKFSFLDRLQMYGMRQNPR